MKLGDLYFKLCIECRYFVDFQIVAGGIHVYISMITVCRLQF